MLGMAMPQAVRQINEARVLEAFRRSGPMSRADLARQLKITRSTASRIVASLIASGVLVEDLDGGAGAERPARSGRPAIRLGLKPDHATFLGADIALDHITVAVLDLSGQCRDLLSVERDRHLNSPEIIAKQISSAVRGATHKQSGRSSIRGLNVSVPGIVDLSGNVVRAPLLGWRNVPLRNILQSRLPDIRVHSLDNDANAFAFAELHLRGRTKLREAIFLLLVDGVGGCLVSNGQIIRGNNGYAGEIGHIIVGEKGFASPTMLEGSLESFVAREPLLAHYRSRGGEARTIRHFAERLRLEDPVARETLSECSRYLGRGLAVLTNALNPAVIVFGGDLANLYLHCTGGVREAMRARLLQDSHVPAIEGSSMGSEASAIGVALMLHQEFFSLDSQMLFGVRAAG
jgi:predicted NBD/HSP70 family sugar kinase